MQRTSRVTGVLVIMLLSPIGSLLGSPIAVDSFLSGQTSSMGQYTANSPLLNQNPTVAGFTGNWTGNSELRSMAEGLTHPAAPWATGGAVSVGGTTGSAVSRSLNSYTTYGSGSGSYYYSSLMKFDRSFAQTNGAMALTEVYNSGSSTYGVRWGFTTSGSTVKAIVRLRTMGMGWSVKTYDIPGGVQADTPYLFIVKVRENYSSSNELIDVWLNPASDISEAAAGTPALEMSFAGLQDSSYPQNIVKLSVAGLNTGTGVWFDELRFGTAWADAVPEPAILVLMLAGAVGIIRRFSSHG